MGEVFLARVDGPGELSHPNVVQIFELAVLDGSYVIAMEYVEVLSLRAFSFNGMNSAEVGNAAPLRLRAAMSVAAYLLLRRQRPADQQVGEPSGDVGWELWSDAELGRLSFTVGATVPLGQWVHVVVTFVPAGSSPTEQRGGQIPTAPRRERCAITGP